MPRCNICSPLRTHHLEVFGMSKKKKTMILLMKPSPKIFQIKKKSFIYVKITRIPIENKLHISPYIVHCKQVTLWQSEIRLTRFSPIKSEAVSYLNYRKYSNKQSSNEIVNLKSSSIKTVLYVIVRNSLI